MKHCFKSLMLLLALALPVIMIAACEPATRGGGYARGPATAPPVQTAQTPIMIERQTTAPVAQAQNLPPAKVAILLPLSGQHAQLGQAMLNAAQMALFDIGHSNLQLMPRDTAGTADGARNAAKSALDDGAELILGPVFSSSVRAVKPIASSARVNVIAFSTDWTLAGGNTYIMGFLPFDQVDRITRFARAQGITRTGIISPKNQYGRVVSEAFNRSAAANGVAITAREIFPSNVTNLAPVVRSFARFDEREASGTLNAAPFEAVLMPVSGQNARNIANLLTHYQLPPRAVRRLGTGLFDEAALASETNLEGTWFAAPSPNARRAFETKYQQTYAARAPRLSTLAFDATALAAVLARRSLEQTGRANFDRHAISSPNGFSGVDGIFRFRNNNTAERGLAVLEFKRGQIVVVNEAPTTFQTPPSQ